MEKNCFTILESASGQEVSDVECNALKYFFIFLITINRKKVEWQ